jgi:NADH-quinone oxidoreductase E subunit
MSLDTATYHPEHQPESFQFLPENMAKVAEILARYPSNRAKSATMPLLDLAQRQVAKTGPFAWELNGQPCGGGWIPRAAMDCIAAIVGVPPIKVYEVASFYTMYNLVPVGKFLVQMCTTTPCMLMGSGNLVDAVQKHLGISIGQTTPNGMFSLREVECLGACVNAPMVQINDDYYEDLTAEKLVEILQMLAAGQTPPKGSQTGRQTSCGCKGPTSLKDMVK